MRLAAFWPAILLAAVASAQNAELRLNPEELTAEVLRRNPEILAAQKKYEASRQRPAQERALPDPMFSVGWNASGNPLPGAGLGQEPVANIGAMASQELPYPGKLRLRANVAAREADAESQNFRAAQLSVIARAKSAYYRLQHSYAMAGILERNRDTLRSLLRVTEARYSVGKAAQADVFRAQTQLTLIETRLLQVARDRKSREAELNSILNRPLETAVPEPDSPHEGTLNFTLEDLLAQARTAAPMLARDQKMIERAETALNLARKDYYPDFTINGGYYNMGSMPSMYMFRADVKVPLHLGKTRASIAEKAQQVSESRHTYEAGARSLEYRIRDEYLGAETARKLMDLFSKTISPQAGLAVESSLSSYSTGTTDFTAVLMNQMAAFEYEMNYHEQMQEFHLALVRLEEMTGVELVK
jgi:outer membrane protein TolC